MSINRREFLKSGSAAVLAASGAPVWAAASGARGQAPSAYPSEAWQVIDERFKTLMLANTPLTRHWTGALWAEGPAWNAVGRYAVFSDIPRARQMIWQETTDRVSVLREQVGHTNGNAFDHHGRLVACRHSPAALVRYEHDGSVRVLASHYQGKRLNAPNDLVVLDDDGIIFTDPGYGAMFDYEGRERPLDLDPAVYYVNDTMDEPRRLSTAPTMPNGIGLSPDRTTLYVNDSAPTNGNGEPTRLHVFALVQTSRPQLTQHRVVYENADAIMDGMAVDADGHIWSATSGGDLYNGVSVFAPDGTLLGRVRLPEKCANVCFAGDDQNRLLMTASQSLYSIYVNTHAPGRA